MAKEILAPLSGKIISINIEIGQQLKEDDEVLIIEAMKMETAVYIPNDGKVSEIRVKVGDEVEEDEVLAILE
jgi:acetyl-CoA carboxylase biotin carboxyl carrier protein